MFERYNEKARRTIFFARYEASRYGSPYIEIEFLLLGLLREDHALALRFFPSKTSFEAIRREIDRHQTPAEKTPTAVDLPLSNESKRVLTHAAEEADRLGHQGIGTEHLFLGIVREEQSFAAELLRRYAVNLEDVRKDIAQREPPPGPGSQGQRLPASTLGFFQLVLKVANLKASIDFYTRLGFAPAGQPGEGWAVLSNGNCVLRLDENPLADRELCFLSPDISSIVSRLQSSGIQLERQPHTEANGRTTAVLRDPDGNIISLMSPRPAAPAPE